MPRRVTLLLQRADGSVVGALAPFSVATPWWQEVETVVAGAAALGADVTVLRLIRTEPATDDPLEMGGAVTYAAELNGAEPTGVQPVAAGSEPIDDQPLRLPWARPGGPARELAWAEQVLGECGRAPTGGPHQMRTWNLSSIWTIPTDAGTVWLKSVPPFFAHEGAIIEWLAEPVAPPLLGYAPGRVLMADIPGTDQYDAALPHCGARSNRWSRFNTASRVRSTSSSRSGFPTGAGARCARRSTTSSIETAASSTSASDTPSRC